MVNCAGAASSKTHPDPSDPEAHSDLLWYNCLSALAAINAADEALLASKVIVPTLGIGHWAQQKQNKSPGSSQRKFLENELFAK